MGRLRFITKKIIYTEALTNYDLIVIPASIYMKPTNRTSCNIINKVNYQLLKKYIYKKYTIIKPMKIGDIRITPGFNLNADLMFIRIPKNNYENTKNELLEVINNMLNIIKKNEYKEILIVNINYKYYGFNKSEINQELYKLLSQFINQNELKIDII